MKMAPKIERKIIEKNRRNHFKTLYSKLFSLLPQHGSKEVLPVTDRILEATNFITSLEMKVKKIKGKKEMLLNTSNRLCASSNNESTSAIKSSHEIEVRQMGSTLHVVVMSGQDCNFTSSEIIRVVHEEGAEVVNTNFSVTGDTVMRTIHANVGEFVPHFLAERVSNKLKKLIYGSKSDEESEEPFWGFEIEKDIWDQLRIQKVSLMEFNPSYFSVFDSIM